MKSNAQASGRQTLQYIVRLERTIREQAKELKALRAALTQRAETEKQR